jgi:hypothetical protein
LGTQQFCGQGEGIREFYFGQVAFEMLKRHAEYAGGYRNLRFRVER